MGMKEPGAAPKFPRRKEEGKSVSEARGAPKRVRRGREEVPGTVSIASGADVEAHRDIDNRYKEKGTHREDEPETNQTMKRP